jgi:peptidoglycan hydrolase-like protein with peptidoglycan-binding domain
MTASMFTLGDMYERGGAVLKDPAAALAWFSIAREFEMKANNGIETPLAKSAQARGEALERVISGVDRERTDKIGKEEFRRIVVALTPSRPPPRTLPLPPMPAPPAAATDATASAPAAAPSAAAEEARPEPAWPKATVDQVRAVQRALIDLHRLRGKADGAAGPATRAAIRDFEKSAGLPETGQVSRELYVALLKAKPQHDGPATPAPAPDPEATAWPARSADQIRAIQQLLVELKLLNAEPTGTVGPLTRRAILDYQRKSGLKETGEPSQALFESLKAARAKAGG